MNNARHSVTQSLLTKIKAVSLGIFAAASLSASTPCCPDTSVRCPKVEIELCPVQFAIKEEIVRAAAGLGCGKIITQCDLPLEITCPGKYSVAQDLNFFPQFPFQSAITINSSDVTLDFNGHTLIQADPTVPDCSGVMIGVQGGVYSNIKVMNGTISNISDWGIISFEAALHEILIDSMNTFSCGYNNTTGFGGGVQLAAVGATPRMVDIVIRNCNFNDSFSTQTTAQLLDGLLIQQADQVLIQNSNFNNTSGNPATLSALTFNGVNGGRIENCNFNGTTGLSTHVHLNNPVAFNGCNDITVLNSQILDTVLLASGSGSSIRGLFISGGQDLVFEDCIIANLSAFGSGPVGSLISFVALGSPNIVVKRCIAQNIFSGATTSVFNSIGFAVEGVNNSSFEDCVAQGITGSGGEDYVAGFNIIAAHQAVFKNCIAQGIVDASVNSPGLGDSLAAGFLVYDFSTNLIFDGCIAQNVSFPASFGNLAFGFELGLFAPTIGLEISNCVAQACGTGIRLDNSFGGRVSNSAITNNLAINNTVFGFNDLSTAGNNVLSGNFAYNPGSTSNYHGNDAGEFGLHLGTPIRTWSFTTGQQPDPTTDAGNPVSDLDNINVV